MLQGGVVGAEEVGKAVGALVGVRVGLCVVGLSEGAAVGARVGDSVDRVGAGVGTIVGQKDGITGAQEASHALSEANGPWGLGLHTLSKNSQPKRA